jgi:UDP-glucose 4-epimerase
MVIPRFVQRALQHEPLQVHGTGGQSRCFLHVRDTVSALAKLMDHPRAVGDVFNIGSQEEVTIEELAKRIIKLTRSRSTVDYIPYEQAYEEGFEDMARRVPDITKVRTLVGFEPTMTLNQIINSVVHSMKPGLQAADRAVEAAARA